MALINQKLKHRKFIKTFFSRSDKFSRVFKTQKDAGLFAGYIRSGLLHQAKTKNASIINIKKTSPIINWIDSDNKSKGFVINRNLFHEHIIQEYKNYIDKVRNPENEELRQKFINKMITTV